MRDRTCDICGKKIEIEIQDFEVLPSSEFRAAGNILDICPACTAHLWTAINNRRREFEESIEITAEGLPVDGLTPEESAEIADIVKKIKAKAAHLFGDIAGGGEE